MADTPFSYTPNPNFDLMRQQAKGAYDSALDQFRQRQRDLLSQSGYSYSTDANGNVQQGGLDVHQTHGAIQNMYYGQGQDLIHNTYAQHQRHLGTYGLAGRAGQQMQFAQAGQRLDMGRQIQGQMNDYRSGIADATRQYNDANNTVTDQQTQFNTQQQAANSQAAAQAAAVQQQSDAQKQLQDLLNQILNGQGQPAPLSPNYQHRPTFSGTGL
jgi:hypothetical protein